MDISVFCPRTKRCRIFNHLNFVFFVGKIEGKSQVEGKDMFLCKQFLKPKKFTLAIWVMARHGYTLHI